MILHLSLQLPEDDAYVGIARFLGRSLLDHMHVVEEDIADVEFVIGELAENVVRHAHSHSHVFLVDVEYHADRVVITVEDQGHGFAFKDVPPVGARRADLSGEQRVGGFGLQMVRSCATRVEFLHHDDHGTVIRAEKWLHYKTPADEVDAIGLDQHEGAVATADIGVSDRIEKNSR
ncbi:MAG TPA: ATP-binding protein [Capsulimonadaceae bacterium]|nr:ATP-binding protein [Capsulimonadaceae bacterium]